MTYTREISPLLAKKLKKILLKNRFLYDRIDRKIEEILKDPNRYKNLRNLMKGQMRVHIGHFVLTFSINEQEKVVEFLDFDHHDRIYKN